MVATKKLVWDKNAVSELREVYEYLKVKSYPSAVIVRNSILSSIKKLPKNPEIYESDRYKLNNNGDYRAFEKYNYRVAYRIMEKEIRILRIRHSSREPLKY